MLHACPSLDTIDPESTDRDARSMLWGRSISLLTLATEDKQPIISDERPLPSFHHSMKRFQGTQLYIPKESAAESGGLTIWIQVDTSIRTAIVDDIVQVNHSGVYAEDRSQRPNYPTSERSKRIPNKGEHWSNLNKSKRHHGSKSMWISQWSCSLTRCLMQLWG